MSQGGLREGEVPHVLASLGASAYNAGEPVAVFPSHLTGGRTLCPWKAFSLLP